MLDMEKTQSSWLLEGVLSRVYDIVQELRKVAHPESFEQTAFIVFVNYNYIMILFILIYFYLIIKTVQTNSAIYIISTYTIDTIQILASIL